MALLVFKIIFLVVFFVGIGIMLCAQVFYPESKSGNNKELLRKITKLRLIGLIIGAVGLLIVLILGYFN